MSLLPDRARVLIVGAGLAGCLTARLLARAGYRATLREKRTEPAALASGNPAGIFKPIVTREETPASRLSLPAFEELLNTITKLQAEGRPIRHASSGLLQLPRDRSEESKLKQTLSIRPIPRQIAHWINAEEVAEKLGWNRNLGAIWFPRGGWIDPGGLCRHALESAKESGNLRLELGTPMPSDPAELSSSVQDHDAIVFCTAQECRSLPEFLEMKTQVVRGQLSEISIGENWTGTSPFVVGEYLIPLGEGRAILGATHDRGDERMDPRPEDHDRLLERIAEKVPKSLLAEAKTPAALRAGTRFTASTHLPIVGFLPLTSRELGIPAYCFTALGFRGILWAPLGARILVDGMRAQASCIPPDLLQVLEPT